MSKDNQPKKMVKVHLPDGEGSINSLIEDLIDARRKAKLPYLSKQNLILKVLEDNRTQIETLILAAKNEINEQ